MGISVVTAAEGGAWEAELIAGLSRGEHVIHVVRRCVDLVDLLGVAGSGQAEAALVDVGLRRLDNVAVDRLTAAGLAVVGVVQPGVTNEEDRLRAVGIGYMVAADVDLETLGSVVETAVRELSSGGRVERGFADPTTASGWVRPAAGDPTEPDLPHRRGSVIAVWGPTGAPGRTTLATTLADEIARLDSSALLIDADVYGGMVASAFGLLDESPGLAAACRQAQTRRLDSVSLAALAWQVNPRLRVLTGIQRADRWPELRVNAIEQVLEVGRALADYTVVDVGFSLETDEEISYDTVAPRRNGATLAVLDHADVILAVGSADPFGMQRLVRGLTELTDAEVTASVWVVLNRVRSTAVPGEVSAELTTTLERFTGLRPAAQLPYDLAALDAAGVYGKTAGEATPNSPYRRAVVDLAAALTGAPVPARGRGRRRR